MQFSNSDTFLQVDLNIWLEDLNYSHFFNENDKLFSTWYHTCCGTAWGEVETITKEEDLSNFEQYEHIQTISSKQSDLMFVFGCRHMRLCWLCVINLCKKHNATMRQIWACMSSHSLHIIQMYIVNNMSGIIWKI